MRILIQRVRRASVTIEGQIHCGIGNGLLVLVGIEEADNDEDIAWLTGKLTKLRIFADESGAMNRSAEETGADILIVSQFTLYAQTKKGNRPSYIRPRVPKRRSRCTNGSSNRSNGRWDTGSKRESSAPICRWNWSTTVR